MTDISPPTSVRPTERHDGHRRSRSRVSVIGWHPELDLEYSDWQAAGRRLGSMARASQWWIGDWIRYGATRWGEKYVEAAHITGYDPHSLRNMAYVASRFSLSLRSDKLTWSHHVLLASLETEEQRYWLERAASERMSVEDLRVELRACARGPKQAVDDRDCLSMREEQRMILCPRCGNEISVS
jgi:hypothetical protein